jgi:hypothetical protein
MKSSLMRPALALALAVGLTACGGKATFEIAGTVGALQYPGLTLSSNGQTITVAPTTVGTAANVAFAFPNRIDYGDEFDITVTHQPAHQTCVPFSGYQDTAGRLATINAVINCGLVSPTLGGTIGNLKADGLVLTNGSNGGSITLNGVETTAADGTKTVTFPTAFTFPATVNFGITYGITILSQPKNQTCTIVNGTGIMGDTSPDNIAVTCSNPTTTP